jgi:hypothetical protein
LPVYSTPNTPFFFRVNHHVKELTFFPALSALQGLPVIQFSKWFTYSLPENIFKKIEKSLQVKK